MSKVKIRSRSKHAVIFEYEDGSTSYKTSTGSGAHDKDRRRIFCKKGGSILDISDLTDDEVIKRYAMKNPPSFGSSGTGGQ